MSSGADIDLNEMMSQFTMVARKNGVKLKGKRRWYWRMRVALVLFRLAAWVSGTGFAVEDEADEVDG